MKQNLDVRIDDSNTWTSSYTHLCLHLKKHSFMPTPKTTLIYAGNQVKIELHLFIGVIAKLIWCN